MKNRRYICDSTAKGFIENKSCLNEEKETLESDALNHSNNFIIRHTMTNSCSSKQQQLQQQHCCSIATHYRAAAAKNVHGRYMQIHTRTSCSSVQYNLSLRYQRQVKVLCCETAHGVYVTKIKTTLITQSSSSDSSTMYAHKTDLIAQTTPQSPSYIFLRWNKKKGKCEDTGHCQRQRPVPLQF